MGRGVAPEGRNRRRACSRRGGLAQHAGDKPPRRRRYLNRGPVGPMEALDLTERHCVTVEIVLLALVALFVGLRLYAVLGRRTGHEQQPVTRPETVPGADQPVPVTDVAPDRNQSSGLVYEEAAARSEEHTSELQSLMRISYAVFCLKKKNKTK